MGEHANATFKVESWDENKTIEADAGGTAFAKVEQSLTGDIEGEGLAQWLMCYRPDKTADFVGLQQISGKVGDREGSFVLTSNGTFDGKVAAGDMVVVAGSGEGDFAGITGTGSFSAPHGSEATIELEYEVG
jgi:hypothetical protein